MCQCVNVGAKAKEPLADAGWYRLLGTKCLGKMLGGSDDRFLVRPGEWRNTRAIRSARMKPATTSFVRGSPRAARIASEQFFEFQTPRQQLQDAMTTVQIAPVFFEL
jgi:hypothetical protein